LPEAHVEAPTFGSVLLAGILLKLGTYGVLRFVLPLYPAANFYLLPAILLVGSVLTLYILLVTLCQVDLKKIIAYSSVSHMMICIIGIFLFDRIGVGGGAYLMVAHGFISSALFCVIGFLYDRTGTRLYSSFSRICESAPLLSSFSFVFFISNCAVPLTAGFVGEVLIFASAISVSIIVFFLLCLSSFITTIYNIWLYNKMFFASSSSGGENVVDVSRAEFFVLFVFALIILVTGFFPSILIDIFSVPFFEWL
jgi:NADH:ubiquinone oxidoreductase subunit 4 (subunit M)